jgi:hypothetical protein
MGGGVRILCVIRTGPAFSSLLSPAQGGPRSGGRGLVGVQPTRQEPQERGAGEPPKGGGEGGRTAASPPGVNRPPIAGG